MPMHSEDVLPFLDLPSDLQEMVYDKLHIADRAMLNAILPVDSRIVKTTQTDREKDRGLSVIHYLMMQRKMNIHNMSPSMIHFMTENQTDPTIAGVLASREFKYFHPGSRYWNVENFCYKILNSQQITDDDITSIAQDISDDAQCIEKIFKAVAQCGTPYLLDCLLRNKAFSELLARGNNNNNAHSRFASSIVYNTINAENEPLLAHMRCIQNRYVFLKASFEEIRRPCTAEAFALSASKVELVLKYCDIQQKTIDAMIDKAALQFKVDIVYRLLSCD